MVRWISCGKYVVLMVEKRSWLAGVYFGLRSRLVNMFVLYWGLMRFSCM